MTHNEKVSQRHDAQDVQKSGSTGPTWKQNRDFSDILSKRLGTWISQRPKICIHLKHVRCTTITRFTSNLSYVISFNSPGPSVSIYPSSFLDKQQPHPSNEIPQVQNFLRPMIIPGHQSVTGLCLLVKDSRTIKSRPGPVSVTQSSSIYSKDELEKAQKKPELLRFNSELRIKKTFIL